MIRFLVGIPAYRRQVDIGHVYQMMQYAALSAQSDRVSLIGMVDADSCSIDWSRNMLMHKAIKQGADWLLMCDADTFWANPADGFNMMIEGENQRAAVIAAPVRRRKARDFNVVQKDGDKEQRLDPEDFRGKVIEANRIGTAFMAVRCGWFVKNWPEQPWFLTQQLTGPEPKKIGEDYSFCDGVSSRGGKILVDGRFEPIHVGDDVITTSAC